MKIIFATQNQGKAKEVKNLFERTKIKIVSLADLGNDIDIEETGTTFYENAFIKAKAIYDIYKTPVISDDSGLEIEQLDGRPGVYSARYAGESCSFDDNNRKVIAELKDFSHPHRAKFISQALYYDGGEAIAFVGELHGRIIDKPRGSFGFGYDPIFIPDGFANTLAELMIEEKNTISHRAKSFEQLRAKILAKAQV
ncbi:MAG: RdgB/HAM1 family non-canonical purine NTP pyrophosphatase [Ignavibacteria bacterium]|nr:MAG: RdgB/HAM1 family non-canonical purine NTP pyrophosphatase [Ignavibacteria bacterium]KAF0161322.1 MAG: RdgB/HAM1 family non-canonical purine NTP pyrophosphatase [Ignavibacteria bacterium]